jgi:type I restriction enzyme S subunit
MSEHVLLSIKPRYVEKIISKEKKYEFRKKIWKDPNVKNVTIYSSSPIQRIIGFFSIENILKGTPEAIWEHCREGAGITEEEFFVYFKNRDVCYAIRIGKLRVFAKPLNPMIAIKGFKAPQNFMYLEMIKDEIS